MSELKTLSVQKRTAFGKGANRRLRTESLVPGVYYTADGQNIPVQMPELPLVKMYEQVGRTNVFNIEIEDETGAKTLHPVFVWDAQYNPVKSTFTHVDFLGVDLDKEIKVKVQVEYAGTPKGVKVGGSMETYRDEVVLAAKPADMPRKLVLDISGMEIGQTIRVSNMPLPEGVRPVYKSDYTMVSVFMEGAEAPSAD
jgi:large subunit ribosomal protein L25